MLKVLYLPLNDLDSVQAGMYNAYASIPEIKMEICDFHRIFLKTQDKNAVKNDFLSKVRDVKPDLVHMQLQFTGLIDLVTLMQARKLSPNSIFVNWSGDVRQGVPSEFSSIVNGLDHSLISSTGQLALYKSAGCQNVRYWQIGIDTSLNFPMNKKEFKYDISFTANHYGGTFPDGNIRYDAFKALQSRYGARFGGFGAGYGYGVKTMAPRDTNKLYNDSVCVLSISHFNNISHYFSDRLLSCLASGRPTITWNFPGVESYFVNESDIFIANSIQEIFNITEHLKANPEIANKVGMNGYRKILREHTFRSRILELVELCGLTYLMDVL